MDKIKEYLKTIRKIKKQVCLTKNSAKKFLVSTGIYTKQGKLTKPYR